MFQTQLNKPKASPETLLFLHQLQGAPPDIRKWPPTARLSLLRGGTVQLKLQKTTATGESLFRTVISAPKYVLMAASKPIRMHLAETNPDAQSIVFNVNGLTEPQTEVHEAALKALSHWATTLCTPAISDLVGTDFFAEVALRHVCHSMGMDMYVTHLVDKYVNAAFQKKLTLAQTMELMKSCADEDDPLRMGLAKGKLVIGGKFPKHAGEYLAKEENVKLKAAVHEPELTESPGKRKRGEFAGTVVDIDKEVDDPANKHAKK